MPVSQLGTRSVCLGVPASPALGRTPRRRASADPVHAGRLQVCSDARRGDHTAIAHQHHAVDAEAILELLDLRAQRHRIGRVAVEHLDRDRQSVSCSQQTIHGLWTITAVIAAVAMLVVQINASENFG
jgi:hypothetical protein